MRPVALATLFVLILMMSSCGVVGGADDDTYSARAYPLPANATGVSAMTVDAAGNVWLIQNEPPVLYKFVRENSTFSNYSLEGFPSAGFTGMSVDEAGTVWFADMNGDRFGRFGAYDEATNRTLAFGFPGPMNPSSVLRRGDIVYLGCKEEVGEWDVRNYEPLVDHFVYHMNSYLYDIHFDRFYNVWFVEHDMNRVGVYWRMYDKTSEFDIPTSESYPTCLSIDSLGRMWFVESAPNKLGMFDTERFNFSEYEMPLIDGRRPVISRVTTVGDAVWLTDMGNGRALRFYPDDGRFAAAELGNGTMPTFIEPGAKGTLWIYEAGSHTLASLDVGEEFGRATNTPTPGPATTAQPSPTGTPQPTKAPGFMLIVAIAALLSALFLKIVMK